jgi:kynurenine formamidase
MTTETTTHGKYTIEETVRMLESFDVIDLSQTLEEGMPAHPAHSRFFRMLWESYYHGDTAVAYQIIMNEHSATHMDAPAHFMREGHANHIWIDELDPARVVGRAATINVEASVHNGQYDVDVVSAFEDEHGVIRPGDIVLFQTGWARKWGVRPQNKEYIQGFPGPSGDLIAWLQERKLRAVGSDNLAFDTEGSAFPGHWALLGDGVPIIENLTNLHLLPPFSLFIALPLKIRGGSGSPVRAVAYIPRTITQGTPVALADSSGL